MAIPRHSNVVCVTAAERLGAEAPQGERERERERERVRDAERASGDVAYARGA